MDVLIRAFCAFALVWVVMRLGGKRQVAEFSALDMVLLIVVGDLVSQAILQEDYSLTAAVIAVAVFTLAGYALGWAARRFPRARPTLLGRPRIVIRDGQLLDDVLRSERISVSDLAEVARGQGIRSFAEVELAVAEVDGTFSFFTRR